MIQLHPTREVSAMPNVNDSVCCNDISANKHAGVPIPLGHVSDPASGSRVNSVGEILQAAKVGFFLKSSDVVLDQTHDFHVRRVDAIPRPAQMIERHPFRDLLSVFFKKPDVAQEKTWAAANPGVSIRSVTLNQPAIRIGLDLILLSLGVALVHVQHGLALHVPACASGRERSILAASAGANTGANLYWTIPPFVMALNKSNVAAGDGSLNRVCPIGNRDGHAAPAQAKPRRVGAFRIIRSTPADLRSVALKVAHVFPAHIAAAGLQRAIDGVATPTHADAGRIGWGRVGTSRLHYPAVVTGKEPGWLPVGVSTRWLPVHRQGISASASTQHTFSLPPLSFSSNTRSTSL